MRRIIGRWAHRNAAPGTAGILLVGDAFYGGNMLSVPGLRLSSPVYDVARHWAPLRVYGLVFVVLAAAAAVVLVQWRNEKAAYVLVPMSMYWGFWSIEFLVAAMVRPQVSWAGVVVAVTMTALHLWVGAALSGRFDTGRD